MATYFASETLFKSTVPINQSVEMSAINPFLESAQLLFIRDILGSKLYDEVLTQYSAQTLTANNTTLVTYIKPCVCWRAFELYLPFAKNEVRNKGVVSLTGEFETSSDLENLKYIRNEAKNISEFYESQLKNYLENYSVSFPFYTSPDTKGVVPSNSEVWDSDLYLPGSNYCGPICSTII